MSDFSFLKDPLSGKWVISAPRRSHRPDDEQHKMVCPFCPGNEAEDEVFRVPVVGSQFSVVSSQSIGLSVGQTENRIAERPEAENGKPTTENWVSDWQVRVVTNKYPFAPYHEVIIHSPDHDRNFDTLPQAQTELVLQTYRQRFATHERQGHVYIFQNHGHPAGESIGHPHSQLTVVPFEVPLAIPRLDERIYYAARKGSVFSLFLGNDSVNVEENPYLHDKKLETEHFFLFCPPTSEWPDEVWIAPKRFGEQFGTISDLEIRDLSFILTRLIQIFDLRHGNDFPFNYYIYPQENWYIRLIPRKKILGGFELGTGISINTQEPLQTLAFIKEHFHAPDVEKIKTYHKANYRKKV